MDWPAFLLGAAAVITAGATPFAAVMVARARARRAFLEGKGERPPPSLRDRVEDRLLAAEEEINRLWRAMRHHQDRRDRYDRRDREGPR